MGSLKRPLGSWVIGDRYKYQILTVMGGIYIYNYQYNIPSIEMAASMDVLAIRR